MNKKIGGLKKDTLRKNIFFGLAAMVLVGGFLIAAAIPTSAIAPFGSVTLFEDNFDQTGSSLGTNNWDNISGENGGDRQTTSSDSFTVGATSKGLLLEGQGSSHSNDPDETAEHIFATQGYKSLNVSYSRAISSFESGDSFVAQYSFDDGAFVNFEILTANQTHANVDFNIDNPNRNTKLTVRFFVNGDSGNDEAGVDNFLLTGSDAPIYYDGFESNNFTTGGWTIEETPNITTTSGDSWTNDNTASNGHAVNIDGSNADDPDDAIFTTINTTGYQNIKVRYARKVDNLSSGESLKTYYSTTSGTPVWTEIDSVEDVDYATALISLPGSADNNANFSLRFEMSANSSGDNSYVDDVVIWGDTFIPTTGSLTVTKNTIAGDGTFNFTGDAGTFEITTTAGTGNTTINNLAPGTYTVSETAQTEWALTENGCESISVVAGETANCTITNTKKGHIIIDKVTDPSADEQSFSFTTSGTGYSTFSLTDADATNDQAVAVGTYIVTEDSQEGWQFTSLVCTDGTEDTTVNTETRQATINVAAGETVTCTYTNTKLASITVVKDVVAPDGTTDVSDDHEFTVTLGDTAQLISEDNDVVYENLTPNQQYSIVETQDSDYDTITYGGDCAVDGTITVIPGQEATCTITNKQKPGKLTVIKHVDNSHGLMSNVAVDFTMSVTGTNVSSASFAGSEEGTEVTLDPGSYSVGETQISGYAMGQSEDCSGTIGSNETRTCTITNYDLEDGKGAIVIVKNLVQDNNGSESVTASSFTYSITPNEGAVMNPSSGDVTQLDPGTYTVSETMSEEMEEAYTQTSLVCTDNDVAMEGSVITLEAGHVYRCTITNDDNQAQLTIIKNTGENYNDTFGFTISGTELTPSITTVAGTGQTTVNLDRGTFNLQEVVPSGWNFTSAACVYGSESFGSEIANGKTITVDNGDEVTCTFTNTRQMGTLRVVKLVEGGDAISSNFTLHVKQGETEVSGSPQTGDSEGTNYTLPTGSYTVSETGGPSGYAPSFGESCTGGSVTVSNEGTTTCTVTNVMAGTLIVRKIVVNDNAGVKTADDFSFAVNGGDSTVFTQNGENALLGENTISVIPGTYTVTEPANEGYAASLDACSEISIAAGQTKTCIITNNDNVPPSSGGGGGGGSAPPFAYTITTAPTSQGFISPAGIISVIPGNSSTLIITADPGFEVANVIIDGASMGPITSHTFSNVQANHTVSATFQGVAGTSTENLPAAPETTGGTTTEGTFETTGTTGTNGGTGTGTGTGTGSTTNGGVATSTVNDDSTITPVEIDTESNPAAAAVSGAGGWAAFLGWLAANWPWLLILVIILALLYWWWKSNQTTPAAK